MPNRDLRFPMIAVLMLAVVTSFPALPLAQSYDDVAQLPQASVDTTFPGTTGYQIKTVCDKGCNINDPQGLTGDVARGRAFQYALNTVTCNAAGVVLKLKAGLIYQSDVGTGGFYLFNMQCGPNRWYIITTDSSSLPSPGTRVQPAQASLMPKLRAGIPTLETPFTIGHPPSTVSQYSQYVRLVGVEFVVPPGSAPSTGTSEARVLLSIGNSGFVDEKTNHVIVDRCYLHGTTTDNSREGMYIYGANNTAVVDSYISDIHSTQSGDTGAVGAPSTSLNPSYSGPILIKNNYLEAAGENFLTGGGGTGNVVDITFVKNHLRKPVSWCTPRPGGYTACTSWAGVPWGVKNLLEWKVGQRVLIEGNVIEQAWAPSQNGECMVITPRTSQNSGALTDDITIRYNICKHSARWLTVLGVDGEDASYMKLTPRVRAHRIVIHDNLADDISNTRWDSNDNNPSFNISGSPSNVHIFHNTIVTDKTDAIGSISHDVLGSDSGALGTQQYDNIVGYGPKGTLTGLWDWSDPPPPADCGNSKGTVAMNCAWLNPYVFNQNALIAYSGTVQYPSRNILDVGRGCGTPPDCNWQAVRFVNWNRGNGGDYRLCTAIGVPAAACPGTSPLVGGSYDRGYVGADVATVNIKTAGVVQE